jgi:dTDP-4-dehydrorhamnose reductase
MGTKFRYHRPELWGGLECTINRVNDAYRDQLNDSGHYSRPGDIARFGSLGFRKLRYPVLWEHHEKEENGIIDWTWTNRQLEAIRRNGMDPIAGLVHHGSGPSFTDLTDPLFPNKLSSYALKVATRFPWLQYYTPVNEPLTTARFSGLYGFWYPHQQDEKSFFRMLIHQAKATVLSMQAIKNKYFS